MSKILNLDKLVKEDKFIILDGIEYIIPAELPVKFALKMQKTSQNLSNESDDFDKVEKAYGILYDILKLKNKNLMEFDDFMNLLNIDQFVILCNFITGTEVVKEEEEVEGVKKKELTE